MSFSYAKPGSGPSSASIGWINFGDLSLSPGQSKLGLTGTLKDGTKITFDIAVSTTSTGRTFTSIKSPSYSGALFGNGGYTEIAGKVLLQTSDAFRPTNSTITIKIISVVDGNNNNINDYTMVVADAESTNLNESWIFNTDGSKWARLATLGSNLPAIKDEGTKTVTITGSTGGSTGAYILTTQSPKNLTVTTSTVGYGASLQAVAIGFAVTRIAVMKNIGGRIDSSDQFVLDISGNPSNQVTTTGSNNGMQSDSAIVYAIPKNQYIINESMALGSASLLSNYKTSVNAMNMSTGGTNPPVGSLPITVTPQLGDILVYTILNVAPSQCKKLVDKKYADLGDELTYTIVLENVNNFDVSDILVKDPAPLMTSFVDKSIVVIGSTYTGTKLDTGITVTLVKANSKVTVSWKILIRSTNPIPTQIDNTATVTAPGYPSINTNIITTHVNHADLISSGNFIKSVDKSHIDLGEIITYSLNISNTGNSSANNVVITDVLPSTTEYVPDSIKSNTPNVEFTGDPTTSIALVHPINPTEHVNINFKVKTSDSIPLNNPLENKAYISYEYTIDPKKPTIKSITGNTNTVYTEVNHAELEIVKSSNVTNAYVLDEIQYDILVTNTGNTSANNVVIEDPYPNNTTYVPGSLDVSEKYTGDLNTKLTLTDPILPGQTIYISFRVVAI